MGVLAFAWLRLVFDSAALSSRGVERDCAESQSQRVASTEAQQRCGVLAFACAAAGLRHSRAPFALPRPPLGLLSDGLWRLHNQLAFYFAQKIVEEDGGFLSGGDGAIEVHERGK